MSTQRDYEQHIRDNADEFEEMAEQEDDDRLAAVIEAMLDDVVGEDR